jgi:hypothetical protein
MNATLRISILTASALALAAAPVRPSNDGDAAPPDLLLNEVLFDPLGAANSMHAYAFVELVATRTTSTAGIEIRRANGDVVFAMPDLSLPAGAYVVVYMGPKAPAIENTDPGQGAVVLTSGHAFADILGVQAGAVVLASGDQELDRISWGATPVSGPFVDISFQGGGALIEGDSIGRSQDSQYSGGSADWSAAGGVNANGATPGAANRVELPALTDLVRYQDTLLNSVLLTLDQSHESSGWIEVLDSQPTDPCLSILGADQIVGQADHRLHVTIHGAPVVLSGVIATAVSRTTTAGSVGESWSSSGTVSSSDGLWGLTLDFEQSFSGAHALQQTVETAALYEWTHQGTAYVAAFDGLRVQTRVDDASFTGSDLRVGVDWSGAPAKAGFASWTSQRLSDGVWRTTSSVARTYPSLLAYPGAVHASTAPVESVFETSDSVYGGRGLIESTTSAYAQFLDGALVARLADDELGSMQVAESYDAAGHHFAVTAFYPLVDAAGGARNVKLSATGLTVETADREVTYGLASASMNGLETHRSVFAVDPPQGSVPLPQPPFRPHGELQRKIVERIAVWVTCVEASTRQPPKQPKPTPLEAPRFCRQIPVLGLILNVYCLYRAVRPLLE